MTEREVNFFGILANVDSSILKLKFGKGVEIKKKPIYEVIKFISKIDKTSEHSVYEKLLFHNIEGDKEGNVYCIYMSFPCSREDIFNECMIPRTVPFQQFIRKFKLFKEGNPIIPITYTYYYEKEEVQIVSEVYLSSHITSEIFHLESSEISSLTDFTESIEFPFSYDFLEFAFKNFELSYRVLNINLRFLTLMNGIEALFNPSGGGELIFRISRSVAVLIGNDKEDAEIIEKRIKELYDKRSKIVHYGTADITEEELIELRSYLRMCIITFHKLNKDKHSILKILNQSGFGESPVNLNDIFGD